MPMYMHMHPARFSCQLTFLTSAPARVGTTTFMHPDMFHDEYGSFSMF